MIIRLSYDNIDRVLASVEQVPADLDRAQLLQELNSILAWYRLGVYHRSAPAKRHKDIEKIVATAKKLRALIKDNWLLVSIHDANLEQLIVNVNKFRFPVNQLPHIEFGVGEGSAFEHLVGQWLRHMFETHFKIKAGYTRNPYTDSSEISGPFIDFAQAVLKELQIHNNDAPYSRSAIANTLSKATIKT
jgi:hypothetical protein